MGFDRTTNRSVGSIVDCIEVMDHPLPVVGPGVVCVLGNLVIDRVVLLDGPLVVGGEESGRFESRLGGCGPNVTRALRRSGVAARLVGHVGQDADGALMAEELRAAGVDLRSFVHGRSEETLALQFSSGETAYVTDVGGAAAFTSARIHPAWLDGVAILHVSGYDFFEPATAPMFDGMVCLAHERNIPISMDVAVSNKLEAFTVEAFRARLEERIRPSVLFCNEVEGDVLDPGEVHPKGVGVVVQHRSQAPTRVFLPSGRMREVPVHGPKDYGDTVGAGDAFAAGFLGSWRRGSSLLEAVDHAHMAAGRLLATRGVRSGPALDAFAVRRALVLEDARSTSGEHAEG